LHSTTSSFSFCVDTDYSNETCIVPTEWPLQKETQGVVWTYDGVMVDTYP